MSETTIFFEEHKMKWETVEPKIQRQIVGYDDTLMMVNVKFEKGGLGQLHQHSHTQVSYIAEGKFEVTIGNEKKTLQKGDSFFVPSNTTHELLCLEEGMLIDVFSPVREDFLEQKN